MIFQLSKLKNFCALPHSFCLTVMLCCCMHRIACFGQEGRLSFPCCSELSTAIWRAKIGLESERTSLRTWRWIFWLASLRSSGVEQLKTEKKGNSYKI